MKKMILIAATAAATCSFANDPKLLKFCAKANMNFYLQCMKPKAVDGVQFLSHYGKYQLVKAERIKSFGIPGTGSLECTYFAKQWQSNYLVDNELVQATTADDLIRIAPQGTDLKDLGLPAKVVLKHPVKFGMAKRQWSEELLEFGFSRYQNLVTEINENTALVSRWSQNSKKTTKKNYQTSKDLQASHCHFSYQ